MLVLIAVPGAGAQEEGVTITFASWDTGDGGLRNEAIINQFMEETGINVEIELLESAEDPTVLVRMAAGTAPDVIQTGEISLRRFALAPEGGYLDLMPFIEADEDFDPFEEYYQEVFEVGMIDGAVYAFDKDFATVAFYVNTDMFEEAGLDIPEEGWTYDDLIELAQELTLDVNGNNALSPDFDPENIVQYGWQTPDGGWVRGWQSIPYAFGAEQLLSDDGLTATGFLNSEPVAEAVTLYYDAVHTYHVAPSVAARDAQPGVDFFEAGLSAMRGPHGPWQVTSYLENPDVNFAIVPMPTGPAGHMSVICWSGFAVNAATEHPDEAYQLVKYFATVGQNTFAEHALTANIQVAEATGLVDDPYRGVFAAEIPYLHPIDDLKTPFWVECIYEPLYDVLELAKSPDGVDMDIQAELDRVAADADECLKQEW
jgi:multiple sugar transport system substrate-binding protein